MSEDAPVNTGAAAVAEHGRAFVAVRRMQAKLHRWAGADRARRFDDLFNFVYDPAMLIMAWDRVAGNPGRAPPGVDRATVAWIVARVRGGGVPARDAGSLLKSGTFTAGAGAAGDDSQGERETAAAWASRPWPTGSCRPR